MDATIYLAKLWPPIAMALSIAIPLAAVGALGMAAFWFKKFNVDVDIEVKLGSGSRIEKDVAKIIKDNEVKKLLLFWRNVKLPYEPKCVYSMPGRKLKAYYTQTGATDYVPAKRDVEGKFIAIGQNIKAWAAQEMKENRERNTKQNWWDRYGQQAIMIGTIVVCMFMLVYSAKMNIDAIKATPSPGSVDMRNLDNRISRLDTIADRMGMSTTETGLPQDQSKPPD